MTLSNRWNHGSVHSRHTARLSSGHSPAKQVKSSLVTAGAYTVQLGAVPAYFRWFTQYGPLERFWQLGKMRLRGFWPVFRHRLACGDRNVWGGTAYGVRRCPTGSPRSCSAWLEHGTASASTKWTTDWPLHLCGRGIWQAASAECPVNWPPAPPLFTNLLVLDTGIEATWHATPHVRHSLFTGGRSMTRKRSAPVKNAARCPGHGTSAKT